MSSVKLNEENTIREMVEALDENKIKIQSHRSDDFFFKKWLDGSY